MFVSGGRASVDTLKQQGEAIHFINEAFKHCKPIAAVGEGVELLQAADLVNTQLSDGQRGSMQNDKGVISAGSGASKDSVTLEFIKAIAAHRHWEREAFKGQINA